MSVSEGRIEQIANAVLYEGYMLYPYRPSAIKNRQRWNFGVLYPRAHSEGQKGNDLWKMQTECLVAGSEQTKIGVKVRFLQAIARGVAELPGAVEELSEGWERDCRTVDCLQVGGRMYQAWQEAGEREVAIPVRTLQRLMAEPSRHGFEFPSSRGIEAVRDDAGKIVGLILRAQRAVRGEAVASVKEMSRGLSKLTLSVCNLTKGCGGECDAREELLLQSMISTHSILNVEGGEFVSSLDPPEEWREFAAGCKNIGTYPVLAGEEGQRNAMLSSPIILYDYPQVAAESPGDLFDGAEIDEILSLRIMTMTENEKQEMRQSDERARKILERTETMPEEQWMKLHGALRGLRATGGGKA